MTQSQQPVDPDQVGRLSQIVTAALIVGVLVFAAVAFVIRKGEASQATPLEYVGLALAAVMLVARFVVPEVVAGQQVAQLPKTSAEELRTALAGIYFTKTIIGSALLEAAAFFNLVIYILAGQLSNLGMPAVLVAAMAVTFPSQGQFDSWAESVRRDHL